MIAIFLSLWLMPLQAGEILVATVAQVKSHVITTREVQINYVLDRLLQYESYLEDEQDPTEQLIHEWLLYFDADDFYATKLSALSVADRLQSISAKLKAVQGWEKLDVTQAELMKIMARKLEARRLYGFKKTASILPVSDSEVEADYKYSRQRYGSLTLGEVREKIRQRKMNENLNVRLTNWFAVLEKKYRVQRFAKYNQN